MPIQFAFPTALLLLPLYLAFVWWQHHRAVTDMSSGRKRAALLLRCILATLLILALAGMRLVKKGESLAVVFLIDSSRSIREDQRAAIDHYVRQASQGKRTVDKIGVITFAQDPHTQNALTSSNEAGYTRDPGATTSTNIEQALRQAKNELDTAARESGKRIVLLSDGNENNGQALAQVPELTADHIVLDTITLPTTLPKEALIDKMVMPNRVKIGEPFPIRVVVSSLTPQTATVTLNRDGKPFGMAKTVSLHTGKNVVVFDQNIDKVGFFRYGALLNAPEDTIAENNKGEGFVWVQGRPTVLYVADNPVMTGFLRKSLKEENIDVEYAPPEAMPTSAAALQRFDSVFLSNVRAGDLSLPQMTALQVSCRDFGVGFGMVGGENSFGAGGYRGTPIEETLPVTMDVKKQKRIPAVAVALVIEDLEIPTTINMSIEAAKATMDLLEPMDQVGVLDCAGPGSWGGGGGMSSPGGTWRIPMQHVTDREALKTSMQKLQDMGDPPSYEPYLLEAARVLNSTDAKVKHIIFLGDGDAVYEQNQGSIATSVKKIRDMGITLSTITTGATGQQDLQFMKTLAFIGGGQGYDAEKPQDLPRLLLKDSETISQPPIIEEPFHPIVVDGDEVFKGIDWSTAPPLLGYNISNLKETVIPSLISHRQDPIFAGWRYGLGRSVAFMSDDRAKWAAQWLGWPGYSKFWAQAMRWTLRPFAPSDYSTQVAMEGNRGHVVVDAVDEQGHYVNKLVLQERIAGPSTGGLHGTPAQQDVLRQTGPGHYEAWFDAPQIGTYLVNVLQGAPGGRTPQKSTVIGLSTAYSPEYKNTSSNRYLMTQLAEIGQGRADPPASAVFGADRPGVWTPTDMVPLLMLLSMLLLPVDIAVRRLALERQDFARAVAWIRGKKPVAATGRAATPELGRLLDRKDGALAGREGTVAAETVPEWSERIAQERTGPIASPLPSGNGGTTSTVTGVAPSVGAAARTLRPEGAESISGPAPEAIVADQGPPEEASMSRLMAAKRRAQQLQEKEREDS